MKPRLAVWAFNQFFLAANRNCRDDKKERQKIHPRFFGKRRDNVALATTNWRSRLRAAPSKVFCADDKKHTFLNCRFQIFQSDNKLKSSTL